MRPSRDLCPGFVAEAVAIAAEADETWDFKPLRVGNVLSNLIGHLIIALLAVSS